MASRKGKYNIKAISTLVGIQPGTLRAWERRYQILNPVRNESGHRLYTEQDLQILKQLVESVEKGFTISQAVTLLDNDQSTDYEKEENVYSPGILKRQLVSSLLAFQEIRAHELIDLAFSLFSIEKVITDILGSALAAVSSQREKDQITVAHERYARNFLSTRISMVIYALPSAESSPTAIAVGGFSETDKDRLLIPAFLLKKKGFKVISLGTSAVEKDLHLIIDEVKPMLLFITCSFYKNAAETLKIAENINKVYPTLKIGVGGPAFVQLTGDEEEKAKSFFVGETKEEWDKWIDEKAVDLD